MPSPILRRWPPPGDLSVISTKNLEQHQTHRSGFVDEKSEVQKR